MDKDSGISKSGIIFIIIFYVVSLLYILIHSKESNILTSAKRLTIAHWQLEDGFREGLDEVIKKFKEYKKSKGVDVEIVQSPVPFRGYLQWLTTQLIGGKPADIIELLGSQDLRYKYFYSLSSYIGKPNPFNKGTVLEKYSWKDTYIDGMRGGFSWAYNDYFGVGTCFFTIRIFVNLDLLKKSTGSDSIPKNIGEWLTACDKMVKYGEKTGETVIPIGVRGLDKATIEMLFSRYYSQMNAVLNDNFDRYDRCEALPIDIWNALRLRKVSGDRVFAAVNLVRDLGKYFGKGFSAVDLEQIKYLFYSGKVGFFPEGTWNTFSIIKTAPFKVGIMQFPVIGYNNKYSKYFTGQITESGTPTGVTFGITKATKNFALALEFLEFLTSYKINQLFVSYPKWGPAVKFAKYEGYMKNIVPVLEGNRMVNLPFYTSPATKMKLYETMENIIIEQKKKAKKYFLKSLLSDNKNILMNDVEESFINGLRVKLKTEMKRSQLSLGKLKNNISEKEKKSMNFDLDNIYESFAEMEIGQIALKEYLRMLKKINPKNISVSAD